MSKFRFAITGVKLVGVIDAQGHEEAEQWVNTILDDNNNDLYRIEHTDQFNTEIVPVSAQETAIEQIVLMYKDRILSRERAEILIAGYPGFEVPLPELPPLPPAMPSTRGHRPKRRGRPTPAPEVLSTAALYKSGKTVKQIADESSMSVPGITYRLKRYEQLTGERIARRYLNNGRTEW
jgi:hypothetical protein